MVLERPANPLPNRGRSVPNQVRRVNITPIGIREGSGTCGWDMPPPFSAAASPAKAGDERKVQPTELMTV
jgi:hypothetical protein